MNVVEVAQYLALSNSRYGRPKRREEICEQIPYFEISKNALDKYIVKGYNHYGHDNEPRMEFYTSWLQNHVLQHIDKQANLTGFYNIELHDSYTYLPKSSDESYDTRGLLSFSKFKKDTGPVLIPDPYMVSNWGNMLPSIKDPYTWEQKANRACFYGTTTGNRNPSANHRIKFCVDAMQSPSILHCKITNIAQMTPHDILGYLGTKTFNSIIHSTPVSREEQVRNKFLISLDGNTCRYDVWNYATNSVTLKARSSEMLWYYPLLKDTEHFIEFDQVNLKGLCDTINMYASQTDICKMISNNARNFVSQVCQPVTCMLYTVSLFEGMANNC